MTGCVYVRGMPTVAVTSPLLVAACAGETSPALAVKVTPRRIDRVSVLVGYMDGEDENRIAPVGHDAVRRR